MVKNNLKDPVSQQTAQSVAKQIPYKRPFTYVIVLMAIAVLFTGFFFYFDVVREQSFHWLNELGPEFFIFILGGFIAQMIDGSLGMAYGVSASTFLLSFGVPPAAASASIHTAEIFTSGISGLTHLRFQNVNKKLFRSLLIPGILGAVCGAYILSSFEEYNYIVRPLVATYTLALGIIIIVKAVRKKKPKVKTKNIPALAGFGGFMDSIGGGGWGPIVASTLIAKGRSPRYTIGSVNLAEFFITLASSLTFFLTIGVSYLQIIAGLIIGGVIAAPIAASLTRKLPVQKMLIVVGVVVIIVSTRLIIKSFV
jgi:uncharacterized protein